MRFLGRKRKKIKREGKKRSLRYDGNRGRNNFLCATAIAKTAEVKAKCGGLSMAAKATTTADPSGMTTKKAKARAAAIGGCWVSGR
jgi:hypothetical protein